jgi:hypothetical protein
MKQGKYISENERRRCKLMFFFPTWGSNYLLNGDKFLLEERLLVSAKKNKKRTIEEGSSSVAQDEGGAAHQANKQPHGGDPIATTSWRSVPIQAWGSVQPCRHLLWHACSS